MYIFGKLGVDVHTCKHIYIHIHDMPTYFHLFQEEIVLTKYLVVCSTSMGWSPLENIIYILILTSSALPHNFCLSHLNGLCDGR